MGLKEQSGIKQASKLCLPLAASFFKDLLKNFDSFSPSSFPAFYSKRKDGGWLFTCFYFFIFIFLGTRGPRIKNGEAKREREVASCVQSRQRFSLLVITASLLAIPGSSYLLLLAKVLKSLSKDVGRFWKGF